ncbi:MAG: holo-ACP synthase [Selenomonadaceae bacterium]|nr:holo-ACP synthase [Selenomonadaceae bacterium]MBR1860032.1 holo-ACP synthase [Selenomonadaceae bacterium]
MIKGIGTDIIEIGRVRRALKNEHFIERVYTKREQDYCNSRGRQAAASYAVRFAGKEAFFKAIGTGIVCEMTSVEIINDSAGCPQINVSGKVEKILTQLNVNNIHISLSHSKDYANAVCIIESPY